MSDADIPHRREDREVVGWIRPAGAADGSDGFVAIDLLGRAVTGAVDWLTAEEALEELGIGYLADPWTLSTPEGPLRVRIVEVSRERIVVGRDFGGAVGAPIDRHTLEWPIPDALRAWREGDPLSFE